MGAPAGRGDGEIAAGTGGFPLHVLHHRLRPEVPKQHKAKGADWQEWGGKEGEREKKQRMPKNSKKAVGGELERGKERREENVSVVWWKEAEKEGKLAKGHQRASGRVSPNTTLASGTTNAKASPLSNVFMILREPPRDLFLKKLLRLILQNINDFYNISKVRLITWLTFPALTSFLSPSANILALLSPC